MTLQTIITAVRRKLQDGMEPFRFPDVEIIEGVRTGYRQLKRLRPSVMYEDGRLIDEEQDVLDVGEGELHPETQLRPSLGRHQDALIQYACGCCLERDGADVTNIELSNRFFAKAVEMMTQ